MTGGIVQRAEEYQLSALSTVIDDLERATGHVPGGEARRRRVEDLAMAPVWALVSRRKGDGEKVRREIRMRGGLGRRPRGRVSGRTAASPTRDVGAQIGHGLIRLDLYFGGIRTRRLRHPEKLFHGLFKNSVHNPISKFRRFDNGIDGRTAAATRGLPTAPP